MGNGIEQRERGVEGVGRGIGKNGRREGTGREGKGKGGKVEDEKVEHGGDVI